MTTLRALRRQAAATGPGLLQAPHQIAAHLLDHALLVVQKIGKAIRTNARMIIAQTWIGVDTARCWSFLSFARRGDRNSHRSLYVHEGLG